MSLTLEQAQDLVQHYAPKSYYGENYRGWEATYLPRVCEMLDGVEPGHCVEVGPGWGTMAVWLQSRGWKVDVVDFVSMGVFITPQLLANTGVVYHQFPIETVDPLPQFQADLVLMTMVFGHLRYRPDIAIRRAGSWLKPEGEFVTCNLDGARHPDVPHHYARWQDMPVPGPGVVPVTDMVTCMFTPREYGDLLGRCFDKVTIEVDATQPTLYARCRGPR